MNHVTAADKTRFCVMDFGGELTAFRVPGLVMHGIEGETVPIDAASRVAAKGIQHSALVASDGTPHGSLANHWRRPRKHLLNLLGR